MTHDWTRTERREARAGRMTTVVHWCRSYTAGDARATATITVIPARTETEIRALKGPRKGQIVRAAREVPEMYRAVITFPTAQAMQTTSELDETPDLQGLQIQCDEIAASMLDSSEETLARRRVAHERMYAPAGGGRFGGGWD